MWTSAAALALIAVPALDRLERRAPYRFALGLVLAGLALRFAWVGLDAGATERYTIGVVAWWFLLGWLATRADTPARRWSVVALAAVGTFGFFGDPWREAMVVAGIALLVHVSSVRVPRRLVGAGVRAGLVVAVRLPDPLAGLPPPRGRASRSARRSRRWRSASATGGSPGRSCAASAGSAHAAPAGRRQRERYAALRA